MCTNINHLKTTLTKLFNFEKLLIFSINVVKIFYDLNKISALGDPHLWVCVSQTLYYPIFYSPAPSLLA